MESDLHWIFFSYRLPSEPSTLRVRAWRILRRIGALSLQQSACVVPRTSEVIRKLQQLQNLIEEGGGETHWLDVERFSQETMYRLIDLFNRDRSEEYTSFIETCSEFTLKPPIAECDADLRHLQKWLRKLQSRDYFQCPTAHDARNHLTRIEEQFTTWLGNQT